MKVKKYFALIFLAVILMLIIPVTSNAASELTYKDTAQGIDWQYELDESGNNAVNLKCLTTSVTGKVTIPSTINGKTVVSLGDAEHDDNYYKDGVFYECKGITEVVIPKSVTSIGAGAFYNCTGLKTVNIPENVSKIGGDAFSGCSGLTAISFPKSVVEIGSDAFYGCTGLKTITMPENLSKISSYAFGRCTGLSTVTFSKNLTEIGESAFSGCTGLKKLTIPDSVTTIGDGAFSKCSGLTEVILPKNLGKIQSQVFEKCSGLTSIKIPEGVTTISNVGEYWWEGAFYQCSGLKKILIPDTVVSIGKYAFEDCTKLTIYGNDGSTAKEYAQENQIPFDYIANWDKASSGADITPPTVDSIQVSYASVMNYSKDANKNLYMVPAGAKLVINVNFNEAIEGSKVPTLTVKFGDGNNIDITEGTVGGSVITYIYIVKNTDKGTMTAVDLKGGNITDGAKNAAKLSCPELRIQNDSFGTDHVYANGTATNPSTGTGTGSGSTATQNGGTTGGGAGSGTTTGTGNGSNGSGTTNKPSGTTTNNNNSNGKDDTTVKGKLPQTGVSEGVITVIAVIAVIGGVMYVRYRKMKDII